MVSNFENKCLTCDSPLSLNSVYSIQNKVDGKIAKNINNKVSSDKNNLGFKFNKENTMKLTWYQDILEQISNCNSCFEEYEIETILNLVKSEINKK